MASIKWKYDSDAFFLCVVHCENPTKLILIALCVVNPAKKKIRTKKRNPSNILIMLHRLLQSRIAHNWNWNLNFVQNCLKLISELK